MRIAELPDQIGGAHQRAFLLAGSWRLRRRKARIFDGARDPGGVEQIDRRHALHREQLRPLDVIRRQRGVGSAARQLDFAALGVDHVAVVVVAGEDAPHIADIVQQAGDQEMGVIARRRRRQKRPALHDVVADQRHEHRVLGIVIERVAVADAFEREPRHRGHVLREASMRRSKPAVEVRGQERTQRLGRQFRHRNHVMPRSFDPRLRSNGHRARASRKLQYLGDVVLSCQ